MTLLRRAAVGVSGFVERHATVGSREWAEGLAREVEVIEGDWKALGWALGSLRVLVDRRKPPIGSLQDVPALAQKLGAASSSMDGTPKWLWFLPPAWWAIQMGNRMLHAADSTKRFGYGLAMSGWIIYAIVMYIVRARQKERMASPAGDWTLFYPGDLGAWVLYYKSELENRLERQRSPLIWVGASAVYLVIAGWTIGDFSMPSAIAAALGIGFVPLMFYSRRRLEQRLHRLNELLADAEPVDVDNHSDR
jgi:hypothetical protein